MSVLELEKEISRRMKEERCEAGKRAGYAKLFGNGVNHVMTSTHVTLGRAETTRPQEIMKRRRPRVKIGDDRAIANKHLELNYNPQMSCFELYCLSSSGFSVNGRKYEQWDTVALKSRDEIAIPGSSCSFHFLLPRSEKKKKTGANAKVSTKGRKLASPNSKAGADGRDKKTAATDGDRSDNTESDDSDTIQRRRTQSLSEVKSSDRQNLPLFSVD
eukprot:jgi/Bigna1/127908/aug1.5_g2616